MGLDRDSEARPSAVRSPPWPPPVGPTSCWPRWPHATWPAHQVARLDATSPDLTAVFYVDEPVRAYVIIDYFFDL
jgi:hypothetical protein